MVIGHGGNLSKAYFIAYMHLIMKSKEWSAACAEKDMLTHFFKGNPNHLGAVSYQSFMQAVSEIDRI